MRNWKLLPLLFVLGFLLTACPERREGSLSVTIGGLDQELAQQAEISVMGPDDFYYHTMGPTTLSGLKPGVYMVSAKAVAADNGLYTPNVYEYTASVEGGKTTLVRFDYQKSMGATYQAGQLKSGIKIVKELRCGAKEYNLLINEDGNLVVRFTRDAPESFREALDEDLTPTRWLLKAIKPVVVLKDCDKREEFVRYPALRKVIKKWRRTGIFDDIELKTEPIELDQVYQDFRASASHDIDPPDLFSGAVKYDSASKSFDISEAAAMFLTGSGVERVAAMSTQELLGHPEILDLLPMVTPRKTFVSDEQGDVVPLLAGKPQGAEPCVKNEDGTLEVCGYLKIKLNIDTVVEVINGKGTQTLTVVPTVGLGVKLTKNYAVDGENEFKKVLYRGVPKFFALGPVWFRLDTEFGIFGSVNEYSVKLPDSDDEGKREPQIEYSKKLTLVDVGLNFDFGKVISWNSNRPKPIQLNPPTFNVKPKIKVPIFNDLTSLASGSLTAKVGPYADGQFLAMGFVGPYAGIAWYEKGTLDLNCSKDYLATLTPELELSGGLRLRFKPFFLFSIWKTKIEFDVFSAKETYTLGKGANYIPRKMELSKSTVRITDSSPSRLPTGKATLYLTPRLCSAVKSVRIKGTDPDSFVVFMKKLSPGKYELSFVATRGVENGTYDVVLAVDAANGRWHEELPVTLIVDTKENQPPKISSFKASPQKGKSPLLVAFTASAEDPDGDVLHCTLDYGDHSPLHKACLDDEKPTRHIYKNPGVYRAVYTVSDGEFEVSKPVVIVVQKKEEQETNTAPTVQFDANPKQGPAPLTVTFTMSQNDEDGDALTCTLDLGDGSKVTGCLSKYPHTYTKAGTYHAVYRVSDGKVTVPKRVTIVVEDQDQGGSDGGSGDGGGSSGNNNAEIRYFRAHPSPASEKDTITLEWSAYDPEGDPLVCSIFVSYKNSQGQWVHRDQLVKRYADADAAKCAQGTLSYKPAWGVGTYIFGLNVRDVNHENEPPAYQPVTVEVKNFNAEVLSFSLNPTTLHEGEAFTYSWTLKDYEGDSIVCRLEMGRMGSTERGTTIYYAKACPWEFSNTYVPKQGPGKYWVSLTIHDTKHTDPVHPNPPSTVIEILPSESENKPPVIDLFTVDPPEVEENESVRFSWQAHDPDGDPLVCGLGVKNVTNGRTEVIFENSTTRCTQGAWSYTPSLGLGDYKAVFVIKEKGASDDDKVYKVVAFKVKEPATVNHKPTAKLSASPTSGTAPLTVHFRTEESDPDGDSLTCTLTFGDGSEPYRGCGDVSHTYTKAGTYRAFYVVTDGDERAIANVVITVREANQPPIIDQFSVSPTQVKEGESVRFSWRAHDPNGDALVCGLVVKNLNNDRTEKVFSNSTSCSSGSRTYRPTSGVGRYVAYFAVKEKGASNDDAVTKKVYFEVEENYGENAKVKSFDVRPLIITEKDSFQITWEAYDPENNRMVCSLYVEYTSKSGTRKTRQLFRYLGSTAYKCKSGTMTYKPDLGPGDYKFIFSVRDESPDPSHYQHPSQKVVYRKVVNYNARIDLFKVFPREIDSGDYVYVHWKVSDNEGDPIVCRLAVWKEGGPSNNSLYYSTNCPREKYFKYTPAWGPGTYHISFTIHDNKHTDPVQPDPPSVSIVVR